MSIDDIMELARLKGRVIALEAELEEARRGSGAGMKVMLGLSDDLVAENARLKAEVERLEKEVWRMKMLNDIDGDTIKGLKVALKTDPEWAKVLEAIENNARLEAENRELKAEVERLRKAGDAMAEQIYNEGKVRGITFMSNVYEWNDAKEGKQS